MLKIFFVSSEEFIVGINTGSTPLGVSILNVLVNLFKKSLNNKYESLKRIYLLILDLWRNQEIANLF